MDPPTSSSSSNSGGKFNNLASPQHQQSTPKSITKSPLRLSPQFRQKYTSKGSNSPTRPLHSSRNAAKIIKGEIHNVLTVMRSDPRYYATGIDGGAGIDGVNGTRIQSRFQYEERQQSVGVGRLWRSSSAGWDDTSSKANSANWSDVKNNNDQSGFLSSHPILQGLRNLYDLLSAMEVDAGGPFYSSATNMNSPLHAVTLFVAPFAAAVCSRDVDAKTTGAALSALHKFIVYGFIGGHHGHDDTFEEGSIRGGGTFSYDYDSNVMGASSSFTSSETTRESIKVVAQCIRNCAFEESSSSNKASSRNKNNAKAKRVISFGPSSEESSDTRESVGASATSSASPSITQQRQSNHKLPSFLLRPRRAQSSKGAQRETNGSSASSIVKYRSTESLSSLPSFFNTEDENVVLKLLSLSVQVLRCPAGRNDLYPSDIVGVFDTCLHVAISAREANRSLLRSAAADALSHCVIVVFGTSSRRRTKTTARNRYRNNDTIGLKPGDRTHLDASDSDDDWGERDPTEENSCNDSLDDNDNSAKADSTKEKASNVNGTSNNPSSSLGGEEPALVAIMHRLAALADPLVHDDDTCILSLTLINIALETMSDVDALAARYPRLLFVMQNDLCRNLLRLCTTKDLSILGLTLRVIFNLFNGIKDHLKVQLEVFITSVHLRILSSSISPQTKERVWSSSPEQRELALESLLEFCREPMLMTDIYLNYDCDIKCTNLFETICSTLAGVAGPDGNSLVQSGRSDNKDESDGYLSGEDEDIEIWRRPRLNILNRLALEGIIAVIDSIARRCRASAASSVMFSNFDDVSDNSYSTHDDDLNLQSPPNSGNSALDTNETTDELSSVNDSFEYDFCNMASSSSEVSRSSLNDLPMNRFHRSLRTDSEISENGIDWLSKARHHKMRKRRLAKAATEFNERSRDKEWIQAAEHLGVLPTPATPTSVASFLYSTPKLEKTKVGLYISKGPKEKYPFIHDVLLAFVQQFSFSGLSFSEALRMFLSRFRLPGEAQCIDRLMEAFATRLYEVQLTESRLVETQIVEKTMLDPPIMTSSDSDEIEPSSGALDPPASPGQIDPIFPFRSADAAYILSFSTIMLNTDLHNRNMKDEKRMTLDQFIRNNRGINDGSDLPVEFLRELYYEIKNDEIQVKNDLGDMALQDGIGDADESNLQFDGFLSKASDVATPFFTNSAWESTTAGVHEHDMFLSISSAAVKAMAAVFVESWDDALVVKALNGLRNAAHICLYFRLYEQFNDIIALLLGFAHDYVSSVATLLHSESSRALSPDELSSQDFPPISKYFLSKLNSDDSVNQSVHFGLDDMGGSAAHRGLMSLECALMLCKNNLSAVNESWTELLDVIFALREVNALPPRISEFDDFADSHGNPLPESSFAISSNLRVKEYIDSMAPADGASGNGGFWTSLLGFGKASTIQDEETNLIKTNKTSQLLEALKQISDCAQLDQIIMKHQNNNMAKRILSSMIEALLPDETDDPLFEHNSVFALELASRLLISNRCHATELFPIFLSKFEQLLSPQTLGTIDSTFGLKFPYILERIVITIMRACIHLYDIPELRNQLQRSMQLIIKLPSSFTHIISDRLGCGAAIILRGCFYLFESSEEWSTIKLLLDIAAQDQAGRGFVFDGIASVVDYALPSTEDGEEMDQTPLGNSNDPLLSNDGAEVIASLLLNFLHGSYEDDLSFKIPSMICMKKVYACLQKSSIKNDSIAEAAHIQVIDWEKMVTTIYNDVCLSEDSATSKHGFDSLKRVLLSTNVETIPDKNWFILLDMVSTRPPRATLQDSRASSLALIERLFLTLMPVLSNRKKNWSRLEDFTITVTALVRENLRAGRTTSLFETTVHTVTNISNVMSMTGYVDGEGVNFCAWVSETLLQTLLEVGACGGVHSMMVAAHAQNIA